METNQTIAKTKTMQILVNSDAEGDIREAVEASLKANVENETILSFENVGNPTDRGFGIEEDYAITYMGDANDEWDNDFDAIKEAIGDLI